MDYSKESILKLLPLINLIFLIIIAIALIIPSFYFRETKLEEIFDTFESSPLFDFNVNINYGKNSLEIFHKLDGRVIRNKLYINENEQLTYIDKINGNYFCYKHISYKELLYNYQIIKKEEQCNNKYPKDCGIIDTLNQYLCIKNNEKCPLYDIGIGKT